MKPMVSPLARLARRFNLTGPQVLAWYTAGVVTALLVVAVYEALRTS